MSLTQILEENNIVGKTITRVSYDESRMAIFFSDDSYCVFNASGYYLDGISIDFFEYKLKGFLDLGGLEVIDSRELRKLKEAEDEAWVQRYRESELMTYERLKMKYGNGKVEGKNEIQNKD